MDTYSKLGEKNINSNSHRHAGRDLMSIEVVLRADEKLPIVVRRENTGRVVTTGGEICRDRDGVLADLKTWVSEDTVVAIMDGRDLAENNTLD